MLVSMELSIAMGFICFAETAENLAIGKTGWIFIHGWGRARIFDDYPRHFRRFDLPSQSSCERLVEKLWKSQVLW